MISEDTELLAEFVIESQEHLENVETHLLTLESQPDSVDTALVNHVFRAVHSIKGAAGFLGLGTLEILAHREEEVLNRLRNSEIRPTNLVVSTLLAATDRLKSLLAAIDTSNEQDVSEHIQALEKLLADSQYVGSSTGSEHLPNPNAAPQHAAPQHAAPQHAAPQHAVAPEVSSRSDAASSEIQATEAPDVSREALREFIIESNDSLEQIDRDLVRLERDPLNSELINGIFRNIHTIKGSAGFLAYSKLERLAHASETLLGKMQSGDLTLTDPISNLLFATLNRLRKILSNIEQHGVEGDESTDDLVERIEQANQGTAVLNASTQAELMPPVQPDGNPINPPSSAKAAQPMLAEKSQSNAASTTKESPAGSTADTTIRVDVALLDKLMTRVGELVLARNQIIQFSGILGDSELLSASQRLNLITTELQEGVMKTRMQTHLHILLTNKKQ